MKSFQYLNSSSVRNAVSLLGYDGLSMPIAGGTDLLTRIKLGIAAPVKLVNLKTIKRLNSISFDKDDGLKLGALATLSDIASTEIVRTQYPALVSSIDLAASPQLRNFATIGGNLMQASRCWYYRGDFQCWLKGGERCFARDGENGLHAIFNNGPCYTVHPSDLATALTALGAEINVTGRNGTRRIPIEKFFQQPTGNSRRLTVLANDDLITEIRVPAPVPESRSTYIKAMERRVWSFALAGVAVYLTVYGGIVHEARLVLGGVAATPRLAPESALVIVGQRLTDDVIEQAAQAAITGARPLSGNAYKVALVHGLLTQALNELKEAAG